MLGGASNIYRQKLKEKEDECVALTERVNSLSAQLQAALTSSNPTSYTPNSSKKKRRHIPLSPHAMNVREIQGNDSTKSIISAQRERLGRNASIATRRVLDHLEQKEATAAGGPTKQYPESHSNVPPPIQRIIDMFQRPAVHVEYLNSDTFAKDLYKVTTRVRTLLEREPRVIFLQSPCYVFGDIHGNIEDLHFFSDNLWRLGMSLTAGNFLFLGDYVDRGLQCLECVAYLFALKLQNPQKIFLLRGNHETRDVNGWEEHYAERSFIYQCRSRFGDDIGYRLWEVCNQAFDRLPLAAVIDQDIFCVHGGIPRPISASTTRIQDILTVPKVAGINPPYEHEDEKYQQVASDCIWSDPASEEQEMSSVDPMTGYGESLRGGGAICFGHKAVTQFLEQNDMSYIMRAHEAHAEGVAVAKGARVFTVFSTSKDHNQGAHAMAGCILVDNEKLQVINRSPAYKNQYVHRRDSVSLANVSETEIQKRIQLGLVTANPDDGQEEDMQEEETWQDFDTSSDDEGGDEETGGANGTRKESNPSSTSGMLAEAGNTEYTFDKSRRSSVDLSSMNTHELLGMDAQAQQSSFSFAENPFGSGNAFASSTGSSGSVYEPDHKRTKAGSMSGFAPIDENNAVGADNDDDDAEIDTVDGGVSDDAMEPEVADQA